MCGNGMPKQSDIQCYTCDQRLIKQLQRTHEATCQCAAALPETSPAQVRASAKSRGISVNLLLLWVTELQCMYPSRPVIEAGVSAFSKSGHLKSQLISLYQNSKLLTDTQRF